MNISLTPVLLVIGMLVSVMPGGSAAGLQSGGRIAAINPNQFAPATADKVLPFDLADVTLLPSPFQAARDRDEAYLLSLEPDRLLHNFRTEAGLPPKAPIYGGWESAGVAGHILGHYLSAISMAYRSTGDARMKQRVDYIVGELALCQQKNGHGYVSAIPGGKAMFAEVAAGHGAGVHRGWVPWYTMHKLFAGLRDAYLYTDSAQAKTVLVALADWAVDTTRALSDDEWQIMLQQEHGGMNEVLADVYAMTGDQKYLDLSRKFYHKAVLAPLAQRQDDLAGIHGNTQIPKLIGLARLYEISGYQPDRIAAEFFWDRVVHTRTFVIGGNTDGEYFDAPDKLAHHLGPVTAETCNTYNMLKLTRHLFEWTTAAAYADFYERALYNHILASQDPERGMFTYYMSLKPGHFKTYSQPTDSFWCCVGTGMENHVKYNDSIYFHDDNNLYLNLFIPSVLKWRAKGITVRQETQYPQNDTTHLSLTCAAPTAMTLHIRYPSWCKGMMVAVNGKAQAVAAEPGSYATVARQWKTGDRVDIRLPMHLYEEAMPDDKSKVAILYGPIVLAGQLGAAGLGAPIPYANDAGAYFHVGDPPVPALVVGDRPLDSWLKPVEGQSLTFRTTGAGQPNDVTLKPFYSTYYGRYTVYWDTFTPEAWKLHQANYEIAAARRRELEARTVDEVHPGEQQSEHDHSLQ
ncbi:MAG: glycoside hydrolase family 127 protein, partial [Armatimonadota bacterium]|nr:glycoside hydrolase family 127 protein [Armatimonadota bacterium]